MIEIKSLSGTVLKTIDADSLKDADLEGANLRVANLEGAALPPYQIPQDGTLTVWKACRDGLAKLQIPAGARRTASLVGRKCRAEYAKVLALPDDCEETRDKHNGQTVYRKSEIVRPDKFDDDPRVECSHGIHFFLTREEAEEWL